MSDSRLFKIMYHLLEKGRTTAPELAAKFEVSKRTIYRDLDALSDAGIPVYAEPGRNGGIFLLDDFVLDKALFSAKEKQEVLAALHSVFATGHSCNQELLTKLSALFHIDMEDWLEVDFSRWGHTASDNSKFEKLKTTIICHREVLFVYANTYSERKKRTVQPIRLSYKAREWYLKAFCLEKQDFRIFKLTRIADLEVSEHTFTPKSYPEANDTPPQANPKVVLSFAKEAAYRVYDEFDETQIIYQENGDLTASAHMPVDAWLIGYLLSFGAQVSVIEPVDLKEILAKEALEIYRKNKY